MRKPLQGTFRLPRLVVCTSTLYIFIHHSGLWLASNLVAVRRLGEFRTFFQTCAFISANIHANSFLSKSSRVACTAAKRLEMRLT